MKPYFAIGPLFLGIGGDYLPGTAAGRLIE